MALPPSSSSPGQVIWTTLPQHPSYQQLQHEHDHVNDDGDYNCDDFTCDCSSLASISYYMTPKTSFLPLFASNMFPWLEQHEPSANSDDKVDEGELKSVLRSNPDGTAPSAEGKAEDWRRPSSPAFSSSNSTITTASSMEPDDDDNEPSSHPIDGAAITSSSTVVVPLPPTSPTSALDSQVFVLSRGKNLALLSQQQMQRLWVPDHHTNSIDDDDDIEPLPITSCPSELEMEEISISMEWSDDDDDDDEDDTRMEDEPLGLSFLDVGDEIIIATPNLGR